MKKDIPGITINEVRWHPAKNISVPILTFDNKNLLGNEFVPSQLPTELFLGYGVKKSDLRRMVQEFAQYNHHVVAVDLLFAHKTLRGRRDLVIRLAEEGPDVVGDAFREEYHIHEPIKALGFSIGASVVGRAINKNHSGFGDIALVQSPELQRTVALSASERDQRKLLRKLIKNIALSGADQEFNLAEIRAAANLLATVIIDQATGQLPIMAGPILTGSLVEPVFSHVKAGHIVHVTHGGRDRVYPESDTKRTLSAAAQIETEPGQKGGKLLYYVAPDTPHLNGVAPRGMRLLNETLHRLENPGIAAHQAVQIYPQLT